MYTLNIVASIWWLFFFTALGLCIGSFLNVVVFRLPMGLALSDPLWSFCPDCGNRIRWIDNLPVIGYLRLRGRCWSCWQPISPRYAVIELVTSMTVILLFDAFIQAQARDGLVEAADLTWRLSEDWPVFISHVILFSALLAMSVIDMQFYWVDIRFTHFAAACGIVLAGIWTPIHCREWMRPYDGTLVATVPAFFAFGLVRVAMYLFQRRGDVQHEETCDCDHCGDHTEGATDIPVAAQGRRPAIILILPALIALFGLLYCVGMESAGATLFSYPTRAIACILFLFVLIVYGASHHRVADVEIMEAIDAEAPQARRMTLRETATLLPAVIVAAGVLLFVLRNPGAAEWAQRWIHWQPLRGEWQPVWGLACAINGYVIAAGIGWMIRIVANLVFGKEAFATGDIHMLAAAGAVMGWQAAAMGFILACFLAVAGWLVLIPFKKSRAIPLGPWLWIGFLCATLFLKALVSTQVVDNLGSLADLLVIDPLQSMLFEQPL